MVPAVLPLRSVRLSLACLSVSRLERVVRIFPIRICAGCLGHLQGQLFVLLSRPILVSVAIIEMMRFDCLAGWSRRLPDLLTGLIVLALPPGFAEPLLEVFSLGLVWPFDPDSPRGRASYNLVQPLDSDCHLFLRRAAVLIDALRQRRVV